MSLVMYLKRDHYISLSLSTEELYSSSSRFSPMLFSKNFIVLCFKFTIHLELIFVKGERTVSRFFFFFFFLVCICPVIPASFVQKAIFAPLHSLFFFVKDQLTIFVWVCSLVLYSLLLSSFTNPSFTNTNPSWLL